MPLHKNQSLDLDVESYGMDAQGVCRAEGMPIFVSGALAGERVRAYVRDETVGALPLRCVVAAALGLVAAVGEVVLLATSGTAPAAADLVFLACEAVAVAALVAVRRTCLATAWESA